MDQETGFRLTLSSLTPKRLRKMLNKKLSLLLKKEPL